MLLAAVHLHPVWSISMALSVSAWIVWYWIRLGQTAPSSRRKIRRLSLGIMAISLPVFVRALSFLDPARQQREYIIAWSIAMLLVVIVIVLAGLDAMNSLRLVHRHNVQSMHEAAGEVAAAVRRRRESEIDSSREKPTRNGEAKE